MTVDEIIPELDLRVGFAPVSSIAIDKLRELEGDNNNLKERFELLLESSLSITQELDEQRAINREMEAKVKAADEFFVHYDYYEDNCKTWSFQESLESLPKRFDARNAYRALRNPK